MRHNRQLHRRRILFPALAGGLAATLLAACGTSAPARFYTLGTAAAVPVTASTMTNRSIFVGSIALPDYLDRPQMAIRAEQGEITYQEFQRWAEPLDAAFLRIFTEDLGIATGSQQVVAVPVPQRLPTDYRVLARVFRFDVDKTGQAVLTVQWFATDGHDKVLIPPRQATYNQAAPVPLEPGSSAVALSNTIADFAADVARNLAALPLPANAVAP